MKISRREVLVGSAALAAVPGLSMFAGAQEVPQAKLPEGGVILVAEVKAKAGQEEAVGKALAALVEPTRKEEGCICYNLHQSTKDKARFMFYEQWTNQEVLTAHGQTPHMKALQQAINGLVESASVTFYELMG